MLIKFRYANANIVIYTLFCLEKIILCSDVCRLSVAASNPIRSEIIECEYYKKH